MRKSRGKPVPVKYGSSQPPLRFCARASQLTAREAHSERASPAATSAISAQAVWDGVDSPRPRQARPASPRS